MNNPGSSDESVARQEEESLASSHYDEAQAEFDEQVEPAHLEVVLQEFSDEELSEVVRLIEDIQNRREEGG